VEFRWLARFALTRLLFHSRNWPQSNRLSRQGATTRTRTETGLVTCGSASAQYWAIVRAVGAGRTSPSRRWGRDNHLSAGWGIASRVGL